MTSGLISDSISWIARSIFGSDSPSASALVAMLLTIRIKPGLTSWLYWFAPGERVAATTVTRWPRERKASANASVCRSVPAVSRGGNPWARSMTFNRVDIKEPECRVGFSPVYSHHDGFYRQRDSTQDTYRG